LLNLGHKLYRNWSHLYTRSLLAHQSNHKVQYLVSEACLAYRTHTCCNCERPQHQHSNRAYSRLVDPLLVTDHCQCATRNALKRYGERRLHADNSLKITALFQLHEHLIFVANLLHLVVLRPVDIL
jgi:hypothetical protein